MPDEEIKRKRGRPKGRKDTVSRSKLPDDKKQYNADSLNFLRKTVKYGKYKQRKDTIPEMMQRFNEYIDSCIEEGIRPGNMGAYAAIGVTKDLVCHWKTGQNEELKDFALYIESFFSSYREKLMIDGEIDKAFGIFWQKNYDGFKDQQDYVVSAVQVQEENADVNELAKRYLENSEIAALPDNSNNFVREETTVDILLKETPD